MQWTLIYSYSIFMYMYSQQFWQHSVARTTQSVRYTEKAHASKVSSVHMLSKEKQNCECLLLAAAAKFLGLDLRCVTSPYTSLHLVDCPSTALSCFCAGSRKGNFLKSSFSFDRFKERLKPLNYHIVKKKYKKVLYKSRINFIKLYHTVASLSQNA